MIFSSKRKKVSWTNSFKQQKTCNFIFKKETSKKIYWFTHCNINLLYLTIASLSCEIPNLCHLTAPKWHENSTKMAWKQHQNDMKTAPKLVSCKVSSLACKQLKSKEKKLFFKSWKRETFFCIFLYTFFEILHFLRLFDPSFIFKILLHRTKYTFYICFIYDFIMLIFKRI